MRYKILSITLFCALGVAGRSQAQSDPEPATVIIPHQHDSVFSSFFLDSLRDNGVYGMLIGGVGSGLLGDDVSDRPAAAYGDLEWIFGKNLIDLSVGIQSAGSIVVGTAFIFGPPTVPVESEIVYSASYGIRLSPRLAISAGLAYLDQTINVPLTQITEEPGWFSSGGTYWETERHHKNFFAVPIALHSYFRWASWFGGEFKTQLMVSPTELSLSLGVSVGFGIFPSGAPKVLIVD